jgi:hypothetical protein
MIQGTERLDSAWQRLDAALVDAISVVRAQETHSLLEFVKGSKAACMHCVIP